MPSEPQSPDFPGTGGRTRPRVVVASAPFKGTLTSLEAGGFMAEGVLRAFPSADVIVLPVSDGGEGLLESAHRAMAGERRWAVVEDPLGRPVAAEWGLFGPVAVVETARASGITLLSPSERNPLAASSRGTGMLMAEAIMAGASRIVVGAGGSAMVDGGSGALSALGFAFLDFAGLPIEGGGGGLVRLDHVDPPPPGSQALAAAVKVACDVSNPLLGPSGAAAVYGPQKGAAPSDVAVLETGLAVIARAGKEFSGVDISFMPMAGSAGGLSGGLAAFLGAELVPGGEFVLDMLGFDRIIESADLVVTGEGRIDFQTAFGKLPCRVAGRAAHAGVKCAAIAGSLGEGWEKLLNLGMARVFEAHARPGESIEALRRESQRRLSDAALAAAREFLGSSV